MYTWVFPKIGVPQNGWFTIENPIKMDDLGVPLFLETPTCMSPCVFKMYNPAGNPRASCHGYFLTRSPPGPREEMRRAY